MEDLKVWAASNTDARVFLAMAKKLKEFDEKVDELALIGVSSKWKEEFLILTLGLYYF